MSSFKTCCHYYRPQRICEGYVFTGVCLSTGGVPDQVHPPGTDTHPLGAGTHPGLGTPPEADTPLGPGRPSRTRYTPPDQVHISPGPGTTPGQGAPRDQVHPPQDQVHPPGTRYTPLGPGTPPRDQVHRHPPLRDTATAADGKHPTGMHSRNYIPAFHLSFSFSRLALSCVTVQSYNPNCGKKGKGWYPLPEQGFIENLSTKCRTEITWLW